MITIVVPAYEEEKTISNCLKALRKQDCEVIVVVGGGDGTAEIAKKFARVVEDPHCRGAGPARNLGVRNAKGEIVLFTDGDTVVPENWVELYKKAFENPEIVAVGGVVKPDSECILDKAVYKINQDWLYRITAAIGFYQLSGNNCGYRREAFLRAGGFNEEMSMLEDVELPMRIKKLGKVRTDSKIPVWTSSRRMETKGYLGTWLKFMKAYSEWFLFGKKPKMKYFASAHHQNG